jgi:DNA mismatch endonuclease, patch repair protein
MPDHLSVEDRSKIMASVRSRDTEPELQVRRLLHRLGYRFRLHRKDLPGTPDLVLPRHNLAIFVHGCFWHGHKGCKRSKLPSTNTEFWNRKIDLNVTRDRKAQEKLRALGWNVVVIWQCALHDLESVAVRVAAALDR